MFLFALALMFGQAATPPPAGALQPQQTTPLPTPATPAAPPAPVPAPGQAVVSPPPLGRVFAAEQGLIISAIKPDKVMDFDTVLAKLRAALESSQDPVRKQQGASWRIFKGAEPGPNGSVLYYFVMDPAVKGADYGVAKILAEAYPLEIAELYRMYTAAFAPAGQTIVNLQPFVNPVVAGTTGLGNEGVSRSPSPSVP